ncbi:organic cation transporter protein [Folsomia candida]|uniref:organic cation transporter protein n=1 Tax=Folsomia candida TaxID=158441 RepID=UPI001604E04D|nr:organic cation transporter protein [Folsomia candida]
MLDFDEMLVKVGEFGIYQKALFAFQAPFCIFVTFVLFGQLFMTLYPANIWCNSHFNCTTGNLTAAQRHNFSFSYTGRNPNPCFFHNIDASFVIDIVNRINRDRDNCNGLPCNYTYGAQDPTAPLLPNNPTPPGARPPDNIYGDRELRQYGGGGNSWRDKGNYYQPPITTTTTGRYHYQWGNDHESTEDWETATEQPTTPNTWGRPTPQWSRQWSTGTPPGRTTKTTERWRSSSATRFPDRQGSRQTTTSRSRGPPLPPTSGQLGGMVVGPVLPFSDNATCDSFVDITLRNNRSRIFFPELFPNMTGPNTTHVRPFLPYRSPAYLPVNECENVTWDRIRSGVPYDTIVTEGGWWCNADSRTTAAQAVFFLGAIVGGFVIGFIADSFGRVPALVLANLLGAIGGALSVVSTDFYLFMFFRFITGMAFDNCFTMMYILVLEFCGPQYRTLVANLSIAVFYTMGTLILPWLAVWIRNWRVYGLVISLPMLLGLSAIFLVPESARWLLSKGRTKEATDILRSFAKVNRKKVDERVFVEFESDAKKLYDEMQADDEEESFTAALKTPRLRRTFILLVLIWAIIALVYDGHSRNILNLADENWNVFWMFTIASMTEFPADMMLIFTLDRFGRRWLSFGSLTMSGAASIIAATIPRQMRTLGLVMAIISRFFVNVAFNIGLQYAAELLPTVIRAQGVNAIHIMGYVASIISPFVALIGRTNPALSLILLGAFAIVGGCLSLFLSETLGEDLPNTLEEAEAFGINQSFWNCPICAKPKDDEHGQIEEPPNPEVVRRNNLRSTMRGETYRSSIISNSSRGSRPGVPFVSRNPNTAAPTETTKLRRITH